MATSTRVLLLKHLTSLRSTVAVRGAESVAQLSDNTQGRPHCGTPEKSAFLSFTCKFNLI